MTFPAKFFACLLTLVCGSTYGASIYTELRTFDEKTPAVDDGLVGSPSITESVVSIDLTGTLSCDEAGDPTNTVMQIDLIDLLASYNPSSSVVVMTGVGWDLTQTSGLDSGAASWLSEMTIGFDYENDGTGDLFLNPSTTDAPGMEMNSSGGIIDLTDDAGVPDGIIDDGILTLEFFETFDDEADVCEAIYDSGSLMLEVMAVPEPTAGVLSMLMLVGLVIRRGAWNATANRNR